MMRFQNKTSAFTLIELVAALTIAAAIAGFGIQYLRPTGDTAKQRSCDLTRQLLQADATNYQETTGRTPSADLRELESPLYSGAVLPSCPITGQAYRQSRTGVVGCPTHETTRSN